MTATLAFGFGRAEVAGYIGTFITVYTVLIFIRIVLFWLPRIPYHPVLSAVLTFVQDVTDPYLNFFRRFIPLARIGPGAIDLSPIVAVFVLIIVGRIVVNLIAR